MAQEKEPKAGISPEDKTTIISASEFEGEQRIKPPYLVIIDGTFKGSRYPLHDGKNTIGRLASSSVVLDDRSVSRQHSALTQSDEGWLIQDLQSKNGTLVNNQKITEAVTIGHKDLIRVGIFTCRLVTQEISPEEEMALPAELDDMGTIVASVKDLQEGETGLLEESVDDNLEEEGQAEEESEDEEELALQEVGDNEVVEYVEVEEEEPPPQKRLWLLLGIFFLTLLGAGLYFYWTYFLTPEKKVAVEKGPSPSSLIKPRIASIPLGPPVPEKQKAIPLFLDCVASPFPASVRFQGRELGKTPLKINVELVPGESHLIEAVFEMKEMQERYSSTVRFVVEPDQSTVPILFRAPIGIIKIEEVPRDISIYFEAYFNYNRFQARPIKLPQVTLNKPIYAPYGRYIMELRQPKEVGEPPIIIEDIIVRREFVLVEDQPTYNILVNGQTLAEFPIEILSAPAEANVFIDRKKVGVTPFQGKTTLGKHSITLQKDGYFEQTKDVEMKVNMPYKIEVKLNTSKAGESLIAAKEAMRRDAYHDAIKNLAHLFDREPNDAEIAQARYLLGISYLRLGDYAKALGYFEQSKKHEKFKYQSMVGLAEVYGEQEQYVQALPHLVEVFLNAKENKLKKEAQIVFQKVSPLRSVVYVYTEPKGALLFVNEKKIEQPTPVILHEMALGNYRLRVEKPGYKSQELTLSLSVTEFKPVLITLEPNE